MLYEICDSLNLLADDCIIDNLDRVTFYNDYHNLDSVYSVRHRSPDGSSCRIAFEAMGVGLVELIGQDGTENRNHQLYWQGDDFVIGDKEPKA